MAALYAVSPCGSFLPIHGHRRPLTRRAGAGIAPSDSQARHGHKERSRCHWEGRAAPLRFLAAEGNSAMLDTIRRAQPAIIKSVLAAVVIAFVGTIFLDWGWRRSGRPDTYLAAVGGEVISVREYQLMYNNVVDF